MKATSAAEGVLEKVPGCEGLTLDLDALWAKVGGLEGAAGEAA